MANLKTYTENEIAEVIKDLQDSYNANEIIKVIRELLNDDPLVEKITSIYEQGNTLWSALNSSGVMERFNPDTQVAIIWSVEDVQSVRPDLTNDQAMDVLEMVERKHDATIGITWDTLEIWADELYPLDSLELKVPYVSVWDSGVEVTTQATVNIKTGEITDIESTDVDGLEVCEEQYIVMNDGRVYVYEDENGFDYWADLKGEM